MVVAGGGRGGGRHVPVMVGEVLDYLKPERGGAYFDGTLGDGGHAEAILDAGPEATLVGVDRDPDALATAESQLERFGPRVELRRGDYADVAESLDDGLAGALLDLGISSRQIDETARGFSFRAGTPLDMRMAGAAAAAMPTAAELLNRLSEAELADIFWRYGEERRSRRLAREVARRRTRRPLERSDDLLEAIAAALGPRAGIKDRARIFQALRIAVNDELASLQRALPALRDRLEPAGVFVVLAYHSLEDREVKNAFRDWSRDCICPPELPVCRCRGEPLGELLTRRPATPTQAEVRANPRSRSARLRAWKKAA